MRTDRGTNEKPASEKRVSGVSNERNNYVRVRNDRYEEIESTTKIRDTCGGRLMTQVLLTRNERGTDEETPRHE